MILTDLHVHNLRNIKTARLTLNPRFNFIIGANGSGKTSLLESIYILGCGHSFRSRDISSIISHGEECLTVFARSVSSDEISVQKSLHKASRIKINNHFCSSKSQMAYFLPEQVVYQDIFQIIDAGPSVRRHLLDWGLFHVKPHYLQLLNTYRRLLMQRNALLKKQANKEQFVSWDQQLSEYSNLLHIERLDYFAVLKKQFFLVLSHLTDVSCQLSYYKGWDKKGAGEDLLTVLDRSFSHDQTRRYTQYGSHQADIIIEALDHKARYTLSRGQQKIILIALKLSLAEVSKPDCLFLFDDLAAELDEEHQERLFDYLTSKNNQVFFTSTHSLIDKENPPHASYFTMNSGAVSESDT